MLRGVESRSLASSPSGMSPQRWRRNSTPMRPSLSPCRSAQRSWRRCRDRPANRTADRASVQVILGGALIVDAHLDIGWNAIAHGRGFLQPPAPEYLVSRSSLLAAGVGLVFATLYTAPARAGRAMRSRFVYENAHEANLMATAQGNYYRSCGLDLIGNKSALATYAKGWKKGKLAAIMLMEGADPIETPAQLGAWTDRGVRIIGPAWG